jgi:hypothetical protein
MKTINQIEPTINEIDLEELLKGMGQPAGVLPENWECFTRAEVESIISKVLIQSGIRSHLEEPGKVFIKPKVEDLETINKRDAFYSSMRQKANTARK